MGRVRGGLVRAATGSGIASVASDTSIGESCFAGGGKGNQGIAAETHVGVSFVDPDALDPILDAIGVHPEGEAEAAASVAVGACFHGRVNGANELGCEFACQCGCVFARVLLLSIASMDKALSVCNGRGEHRTGG